MVRRLVAPADDRQLGAVLARIRSAPGPGTVRLNLNLLGEAILGDDEAARRLEGTQRLLARPDVDYVSVKVSSMIAPHSPWAFDATVDRAVQRLVPLFEVAAAAPTGEKFINLDMEEYRDPTSPSPSSLECSTDPSFIGLKPASRCKRTSRTHWPHCIASKRGPRTV